MRYSGLFGWALAGVVALGITASPGKAQDGYWHRDNSRHEYTNRDRERDLQRDYENVYRLKRDMAADERRLNRDYWSGRSWKAERDARDLARDRREVREQFRNIRQDKREMYRDRRYRDYDRY